MKFLSLFEPSLLEKKKKLHPILEQLEDRTLMSVTVGISVDGMNTTNNSCNCQPPDTIAAAGPNHIVEMVNTAIEVFNKNGTVAVAPQSTLNFFSNHVNGNHSDPFVFYDELAGKFVAGILDYASSNSSNYVDFATGVDSPSGITWSLHSPYASGEGRKFLDYPRVGYNADAYFIEGNMFRGGRFSNIQVITIDKSTLNITSRHDDSSLFTLTPAAMHGATSGGPEYFVEAANGGASSLQVVTETNVLSSSPTFTTSSVSVTAYSGGGSPPGGVASFDDRIFSAAFRNVGGVSHLVAAHQVSGGSVPVVARWYDINAGSMSLIQSGNAPAGVSGASTFMPSADINTAGSIGMTFGESASNESWSMYVTERIASDPAGSMEAAVRVATGIATTSDSRVGDYSGTSVDPSDGLTFWSANEYQGADFWDTHIASFKSSTGVNSPVATTIVPTTSSYAAPNLQAALAHDPTEADIAALNDTRGLQAAKDNGSAVSGSATSDLDGFFADVRNWDFPAIQF